MGNAGSAADMNSEEAEFIRSEINNNCIVIFSKTSCPYCSATKNTFKKLKVNPKVIELNTRADGSRLQDILSEMTGARTVPRVFINGQSVGGNSETQALYNSGKLSAMIEGCKS